MKLNSKNFYINDKYELISQISHTNNSKIYKAYDHKYFNYVVVKIIKINDDNDQKSVENEIKILSLLECSVIPKYIDSSFNFKNNAFCIIMEYVNSITLKEKMNEKNGLWTLSEISMIFYKILKGVKQIHTFGVVHNDLKPENIIYLRTGGIKIIDFGISTLIKNNKNSFFKLKGTPKYIAPEIIINKFSDERSDIYSLGIILYELLTGVSPFETYNKNQIIKLQSKNNFVNPKILNPRLSNKILIVVNKALETQPNNRYQSIEDFKNDFKKAIEIN